LVEAHAREPVPQTTPNPPASAAGPIPASSSAVAVALRLQRAAGNRAARRVLARAPVAKDVTRLDDTALQIERERIVRALDANATSGADRQADQDYLARIDAEIASRNPPPPARTESPSPAAGQSRNYPKLSDDELARLSRQGDTRAAQEITARARARGGAQPQSGREQIGPEEMPIGPEGPPLRSGNTQLESGDIDRYGAFNTRARSGDPYEGHEVLQNAFLKATGQTAKRGTGTASRGNPSIALDEPTHARVSAEQARLGLNDPQQIAQMSADEVIARNVLALERAGIERSQVETIRGLAMRYAAQLGGSSNATPATPAPAAEPTPSPTTSSVAEPVVEGPPAPPRMATPEPNLTTAEPNASVESPPRSGGAGSGAPISGEPGVVGAVVTTVAVPLILGKVHDAAVEAIRDERGYAPVGPLAYAHEGAVSRFARAFTGAAAEEQIAELPGRFNVTVFRANARRHAGAVQPGGELLVLWQVPIQQRGLREVRNLATVYRKSQDGKWSLDPARRNIDSGDVDTQKVLIGLTMPVYDGETQTATIYPPDFNVVVGTASDIEVARHLHVAK
jgi:hypothetical protein